MVKSFGEILKSHTRSSDASGRWSVEPTDPFTGRSSWGATDPSSSRRHRETTAFNSGSERVLGLRPNTARWMLSELYRQPS